jgi:hypothetical protein
MIEEDKTQIMEDVSSERVENEVPKKATAAVKKTSPKKRARKKTAKKGSKSLTKRSGEKSRVRRSTLFPASSFEEALTIPNAIQKHAAGQKVRRLTLFDQIKKSPDSGPSRQWITNANKYGLIKGNYNAEYLELTPEGTVATNNEVATRERESARFKLAIEDIAPFKMLYESQKGNRLPATSILEDIAKENGVPSDNARECVETFIVNAKFLGVLKPIAGAERIISLDQALDDLPRTASNGGNGHHSPFITHSVNSVDVVLSTDHNFDTTCFYISPIGDDDSEDRKHADLFLGSIVEPALEEFELNVVRADKIGKPGMITSQIIEYILKSKLVVADLSFHNPNVFYELALRHVCRLPTVQIIRFGDKIPFDLDQYRTVRIDTSDIYSLVPNLQTYKAEIATQVRAALAGADSVDNPLSTYYPNLRVSF